MDLQTLCSVLQGCLSTVREQRDSAETILKQHEGSKGQIVNLLRVASEPTVDLGVRQVAAISFKNLVKRNWEPEEGAPPLLDPEDKQLVRDNLLEALIRAPHVVQSQLSEVFKLVVYADYPEQWPGLLETVVAALQAGEEARVHGGLMALRVLARKYEFKDEDERGPLDQIVSVSFPLLLPLYHSLLANPSAAPALADCHKLVCKTFWSATFMGIPSVLLQEEQFTGWMEALHKALCRPLPLEHQPVDRDERMQWPWWKARKWVLHITYRLFNRFGSIAGVKPGNDKRFAQLFVAHVSNQLLEDHLRLLQPLAAPSPPWMHPRVVNLTLQYITRAIEYGDTYKLLKPHAHGLLFGVVFPLLSFNQEDQQLWEDDPQEFIRKGYDILEDMYSSRTSAANLLHTLVVKKPKAHLDKVMRYCASVLHEYAVAAAAGPVSQEQSWQMDGVLLAVGSLHDVLKRKAPYNTQLDAMLQAHVLPTFDSPSGHLRAKAAWIAKEFADTAAAAGAGPSSTYAALFSRVLRCLSDPELPVRVEGVVAVRSFVEELEEPTQLGPILPQLLDSIFGLMNTVENEELVFTLEAIVEKLGDEVAPHAIGLATNLAAAFWKYSGQSDEAEEDEEDTAMAAYGCIRALNTLIDSCCKLPPLLAKLEDVLFPILERFISTDGQDIFEDVLEMLSFFTYYGELTPRLWSLWPQLHTCLVEWGIDYWDSLVVPLDNFISRGTPVYLGSTNPDYQDSVYQMVKHSLEGDKYNENDIVHAPQLLGVVLQHCRGQVDRWVDPYIRLLVGRLPHTERRVLKDALMVGVANAFYYDAGLALRAVASMGATAALFGGWFKMILERRPKGSRKPLYFRLQADKKVCVLGLAAILTLPDAALPPEVAAGLPQLLSGIMQLLMDLKAQQEEAEKREEEEEEEEEDDDGEGGDEDLEDGDDADDKQGEEDEDAYMARLRRAARDIMGGEEADDEDSEDWSDDDDDGEVHSPIDAIEPFVHFAEVMGGLQVHLPGRYALLLAGVDDGVRAAVGGMVLYAAAQREQLAAAAAQQQQQPGQAAPS